MNGHYMDWTTYLTDDPMTIYQGKIPNGPINKFYEVPAGEFLPTQKVSQQSLESICSSLYQISFDGYVIYP